MLDLSFRGRPVGGDDRFVLVTNSHAAGDVEMPASLRDALGESTLCTTVIADHIRRIGLVQPMAGEGWRLAPLPGRRSCMTAGRARWTGPGRWRTTGPSSWGSRRRGIIAFACICDLLSAGPSVAAAGVGPQDV